MLNFLPRLSQILLAAGSVALIASCGVLQDEPASQAIPAVVKTATVGGLTQSCSRWRADSNLVASSKNPIAKDLTAVDAGEKTLEEQFGGYWSSRASALKAVDRAIKKNKSAVAAIDRAPKEPDAAFTAIRRDLRAGLTLRLKALRLVRRSVVERKPVLLADAYQFDADGIERYQKGVNAKAALQTELAAQCPGQPW